MMCRHSPYWITNFFYFLLYDFFILHKCRKRAHEEKMPVDLNKDFTMWREPGKTRLANRGCTPC